MSSGVEVMNIASQDGALDRYLHNAHDIPASERLHAACNVFNHDHADVMSKDLDIYHQLFPHLDLHNSPVWQAQRPQTNNVQQPNLPAPHPKKRPAPKQRQHNYYLRSTTSSPLPSLDSAESSDDTSGPSTDSACENGLRAAPRVRIASSAHPSGSEHPSATTTQSLPAGPSHNTTTPTPATHHAQSPEVALPCAFSFLDCTYTSTTAEIPAWISHHSLHTRSRPAPAAGLACPTCHLSLPGWNRWLKHIADHAMALTSTPFTPQTGSASSPRSSTTGTISPQPPAQRPADELVEHLWRQGLIDANARLELLRNGRLGQRHRAFLNMYNPREERRGVLRRDHCR